MHGEARAPRIVSAAWGRIEVEGGRRFKDAKLFPGGAAEWDWNETGTRHRPGIQPADLAALLEHGARHVVLSRGRLGMLGVCPETLRELERRGVTVEVLRTAEAVERYNAIRENEAAGGLFHSTC